MSPKMDKFMIHFTTVNKYRRNTNDVLRKKSIDTENVLTFTHKVFGESHRNDEATHFCETTIGHLLTTPLGPEDDDPNPNG